MKQPKTHHDVYQLCERASKMLKAAGFEVVDVSRRSEAVYFHLPGRHGVLRVSAHKTRCSVIGLDSVVSKLTFCGNHHSGADILVCSDEKIESMVWAAVGHYIMKSAEPIPSNYAGERGTWEHKKARVVQW